VLALFCAIAPLVAWIIVGIVGAVDYAGRTDEVVYVAVIGGMIVFFATIALLSPLAFVAAVLGVVSFWRPGSKAPGIVALVFGILGSLGLVGLPVVLGEVIPGL
jgi:hypothetical protein